jgi:CRP/FNR family cyclic AMP-dependent transcriptional regulator
MSLESQLRQHSFLVELEPHEIRIITPFASNVRFRSGEFVFRQGEAASTFYLIESGKVDVEFFAAAGGPVVLQTLKQGDILGWSWLRPPFRWRFDARAVEDTEAIAIDGAGLRNELDIDHDMGYVFFKRFLEVMTARLEAARLRLVEMYAAHS